MAVERRGPADECLCQAGTNKVPVATQQGDGRFARQSSHRVKQQVRAVPNQIHVSQTNVVNQICNHVTMYIQ